MATGWKKDYLRYKDFFLNVKNLYNTKPNLKIYLELVLSVVTVGVFAYFAIKPTVLTIIELNKEINEKTTVSAQLKQKVKSLQVASNLLQSNSEDIGFVELAVPKTAMPEQIVVKLKDIATENSLQILGMSLSDVTLVGKASEVKKSVSTTQIADGANELPFTFSATGSYQNILLFIDKTETLRRPIKIDSFVINSTATETEKKIVLTISGRVPYAE